MIIGNEVH